MCAVIAASVGAVLGQTRTKPATTKPVVVGDEKVGTINVYVGTSQLIRSPWPVTRVSITAPEIADVHVLTPEQVLLLGRSPGKTDLLVWGKDDRLWRSKVDVSTDVAKLRTDLATLFPDARIELFESGDTLVVSGVLARAEQAVGIRKFLGARRLKYVDLTRLAGVQQVKIRVRVAEVSRQVTRTLGINAFKTGDNFFVGAQPGAINPISIGVPAGTAANHTTVPFIFTQQLSVQSPAVSLFAGFPDYGLEFFIQALQENQYLRLLAEPTLVALSGEEASFLAGGEFPIPVPQGSDAGGTTITIEYREFGVRLAFRPVVLGDGTIRLKVAPEVSETTEINAYDQGGFQVPSLLVRKAETTLEMKSGQTFAMAGLISRGNQGGISKVPALGNLPVLGALFRSVRYQRRETEMVVFVTASLVEPINVDPSALPGMLHTAPSDWELYAEGRIEGKTPAKLSEADAAWLKRIGLDRLKGPGAWATYETAISRSQSTARPASDKHSERTAPSVTPKSPAPPAGPKGPTQKSRE